MPLIKDGHFTLDTWTAAGPDTNGGTQLIVPLERLEAEGEVLLHTTAALGVEVPNNTAPERLLPWLDRLALITVAFPSVADGRGFSLGKRLRRLGFTGELRAKGHVIADQYASARACGFDTVEINDALARRQMEVQWQTAARSMSLAYQPGYDGAANILAARHAARRQAA
jgi:uncharacterized protein (DUF934 family)